MRNVLSIVFSLLISYGFSQELLANVSVDFSQVQSSSTTAYNALEKSLKDFINTTKWTDKRYKTHEKIECTFNIVIQEKTGSNTYSASLLIQSRRPVYNSNYYTPILNINDKNFSFQYTEYEQLIFNERSFSGKNLTDMIGFYVYLILGYDADTFKSMGGSDYFKKSQAIANNGASSSYKGWSEIDGPRSRISLMNRILAPNNSTLRKLYYTYHIRGLDTMGKRELNAKNAIGKALLTLEKFKEQNNYAQNYPLDIFFQAKKAEISQIFSGGVNSTFGITKLKNLFNTISPTNTDYWDKLEK